MNLSLKKKTTNLEYNQYSSKPRAFSRMDRSFLGVWWWTVDRTMLVSIFLLIIFGVILVATASPSVAQRIGLSDYYFIKKHIFFLAPTFFLIIAGSMLPIRYVWRIASIILLGSIFMMFLVLLTGTEEKGAKRWIYIFGFSLQPSEFIKPSFIIVVSWLIAVQKKIPVKFGFYKKAKKENKSFPVYYTVILGLYSFLIILLIMQPDLGMSIVVTCVLAVQIFLAGLRFRYIAVLFAVGSVGLTMAYFSLDHVKSRIDRFFDPTSGDNFQVERSLATIKNGGIIGVGPGQGIEKTHLPDAHADFTFSVLVEEGGLFFSFALLGLFLFILLRGFKRLKETYDVFSVLAAGGLLTMFAFQSLIHMGSNVNLIPAKGMTLPFISYGGSSMLSMGLAFGMILALTRQKGSSSIAHSSITISAKSCEKSSEKTILKEK